MTPPTVDCDTLHATLVVAHLPAALAFYTNRLGFQLAFTFGEPATFAGVNLGQVQIFLSEGEPNPNPDARAVFFKLEDAEPLHAFHQSTGVDIVEPIDDRHYGIRDYTVRDPDGYLLGFGHHIFSTGDPLPIQRIDLPVRLEKRLAALLLDLAQHKRMSLSSCLEEMILHTNEGVGPHTKATLRFIPELRRRHGIDYDCHASYRFQELPPEPGPEPLAKGPLDCGKPSEGANRQSGEWIRIADSEPR